MDNTDRCSPTELPHTARMLAHGAVGHVTQCRCGQLHLSLEYLTLRFEPAAFRELAVLLARAQRRLEAEALAHGDEADAPAPCRPVH